MPDEMVLEVARCLLMDVYVQPPSEKYPAKLYADIKTASSTMRVVIEGYTLEAIQGVALEPVTIRGALTSRRYGKDQFLTLVRPVIRRLVAPANGAAETLEETPEPDVAF